MNGPTATTDLEACSSHGRPVHEPPWIAALRLRTRAELALENLALRQQLANLRHMSGRPRIRMADRAFWIVLSRLWSRWADVLVIVKPDTVVSWHRAVSVSSGAGSPARAARRRATSPPRSRLSFSRWPKPTWAGARPES